MLYIQPDPFHGIEIGVIFAADSFLCVRDVLLKHAFC